MEEYIKNVNFVYSGDYVSVKTRFDFDGVLRNDCCDEEPPDWHWYRSFATLRMTLLGSEFVKLIDPVTLGA